MVINVPEKQAEDRTKYTPRVISEWGGLTNVMLYSLCSHSLYLCLMALSCQITTMAF